MRRVPSINAWARLSRRWNDVSSMPPTAYARQSWNMLLMTFSGAKISAGDPGKPGAEVVMSLTGAVGMRQCQTESTTYNTLHWR